MKELANMKTKLLGNGATFYWNSALYSLHQLREGAYYKEYKPKETDVIMDIGANAGDMVALWGPLVKEMHSYEPVPHTFEMLVANKENNNLNNCHLYEAAVGDSNIPIQIWFKPEGPCSTVSASALRTKRKKGRSFVEVPQIIFNDEVRRIKPTVIKMDIEGSEKCILDEIDLSVFEDVNVLFVEYHPDLVTQSFIDTNVEHLKRAFPNVKMIEESIGWNKIIGVTYMFTK